MVGGMTHMTLLQDRFDCHRSMLYLLKSAAQHYCGPSYQLRLEFVKLPVRNLSCYSDCSAVGTQNRNPLQQL